MWLKVRISFTSRLWDPGLCWFHSLWRKGKKVSKLCVSVLTHRFVLISGNSVAFSVPWGTFSGWGGKVQWVPRFASGLFHHLYWGGVSSLLIPYYRPSVSRRDDSWVVLVRLLGGARQVTGKRCLGSCCTIRKEDLWFTTRVREGFKKLECFLSSHSFAVGGAKDVYPLSVPLD